MVFVDTNIVLRWLLGDHPELSQQAEKLVSRSRPDPLVITDIVAAEIVYVLRSTGRNRLQTVTALELILRTAGFHYENEALIQDIMGLLGETKLDFADCYLIARARRSSAILQTFDSAMAKVYNSHGKRG